MRGLCRVRIPVVCAFRSFQLRFLSASVACLWELAALKHEGSVEGAAAPAEREREERKVLACCI